MASEAQIWQVREAICKALDDLSSIVPVHPATQYEPVDALLARVAIEAYEATMPGYTAQKVASETQIKAVADDHYRKAAEEVVRDLLGAMRGDDYVLKSSVNWDKALSKADKFLKGD